MTKPMNAGFRFALLILLVFLALIAATLMAKRSNEPDVVAQPATSPTLTENPDLLPPKASAAPISRSQAAFPPAPIVSSRSRARGREESEEKEDDPRNPRPKTVAFRVVEDNLAVTHGDIILGQVPSGDDVARSGRYEPPALRLWETVEIPYAIDAGLPNPARVEQAIAYFNEHTPMRFVRRKAEPDAIVFQAGEEHCYSSLGRTGGLQPVRLSAGCRAQEIIHELMHAIGFVHEQSRTDRDQNIAIDWDNVDPKYRDQFAIVPDSLMEAARGTAFDFRSVMLYRPTTFAAREGALTFKPLDGHPRPDPVQEGLSEGDILRLKRLYRIQ